MHLLSQAVLEQCEKAEDHQSRQMLANPMHKEISRQFLLSIHFCLSLMGGLEKNEVEFSQENLVVFP